MIVKFSEEHSILGSQIASIRIEHISVSRYEKTELFNVVMTEMSGRTYYSKCKSKLVMDAEYQRILREWKNFVSGIDDKDPVGPS